MSLPVSGIPTWARNVALGVAIMIGAMGLFVTRLEYAEITHRLDAQAETLERILWRLGGPIPQSHRSDNASMAGAIESAWREALTLAKYDGPALERPDILIEDEPRYIINDVRSRVCGYSFGYYVPDGNGGLRRKVRIELYLLGDEQDVLHDGLVHEFLHYILGAKVGMLAPEDVVRAIFNTECPAR